MASLIKMSAPGFSPRTLGGGRRSFRLAPSEPAFAVEFFLDSLDTRATIDIFVR
jgi:hypothetical protein